MKPIKDLRIAVLLPCHKRHEYTKKCLDSMLEIDCPCQIDLFLAMDGADEETWKLFNKFKIDLMEKNVNGKEDMWATIRANEEAKGLRSVIIDFFNAVRGIREGIWYNSLEDGVKYDFIAKMDNDCLVPKEWLNKILAVFANSDADILSPNVYPSNAAFTYGREDTKKLGYRPAEIVGGLWCMKANLIEDMYFERHELNGLIGAVPLLRQIVTEKEPKIGWVPDVVVEDMGHWSGMHPEHIKSEGHYNYSKEVGRSVAWSIK